MFFWKKSQERILFISGGGSRGIYALGILKRMEELDMKKDIKAIFGVSVGAIIGSLWSNGVSAQEVFDIVKTMNISNFYSMHVIKSGFKSLISNTPIKKILKERLPKKIEDSPISLYLGACDINTAKFILFNKGELVPLILASMAIPGLFPSIQYENYNLVDGGVINPFPVNKAKKRYPKTKIIGINLNSFISSTQEPKNIFELLSRSFNILMKSRAYEQNQLVDELFFRELDVGLLDFDKKRLQVAFDQGYQDAKKKFG